MKRKTLTIILCVDILLAISTFVVSGWLMSLDLSQLLAAEAGGAAQARALMYMWAAPLSAFCFGAAVPLAVIVWRKKSIKSLVVRRILLVVALVFLALLFVAPFAVNMGDGAVSKALLIVLFLAVSFPALYAIFGLLFGLSFSIKEDE